MAPAEAAARSEEDLQAEGDEPALEPERLEQWAADIWNEHVGVSIDVASEERTEENEESSTGRRRPVDLPRLLTRPEHRSPPWWQRPVVGGLVPLMTVVTGVMLWFVVAERGEVSTDAEQMPTPIASTPTSASSIPVYAPLTIRSQGTTRGKEPASGRPVLVPGERLQLVAAPLERVSVDAARALHVRLFLLRGAAGQELPMVSAKPEFGGALLIEAELKSKAAATLEPGPWTLAVAIARDRGDLPSVAEVRQGVASDSWRVLTRDVALVESPGD